MSSELPVIFTIGRMNPPHRGHLILIQTMINKAVELRQPRVFVILSHSNDVPKNPLNCETKRMLLNQMIASGSINTQGIEVVITCMDDDTTQKPGTFNGIRNVLTKNGYPQEGMKCIIYAGQDPKNSYGKLFECIKSPTVQLKVIELPREIDPATGDISVDEISASKIRKLAVEGNEDDFISEMGPTGLNISQINVLYRELRRVLLENPDRLKKSPKGGTRKRRTIRKKDNKKKKN